MHQQIASVHCMPMPAISWGDDFYKDVSVLKITLKNGLVGLGGAYTSAHELEKVWREFGHLLDLDSLELDQIATLIAQLCSSGEHLKRPDLVPALSALDIALWDLHGQSADKSIATLLGGSTAPRIKAYASLEIPLPRNVQDFEKFEIYLRNMLSQNFKAIKLYFPRLGYRESKQVNGSIGVDKTQWTSTQWERYEAQLFQRARDVVGPDIDLMLDVFGSADDWPGKMDWAQHITSHLEQQKFLWFEEPFRPDDIQSYKTMGAQTSVALSACEFFTDPAELVRWANEKAVSILQPDCTCGGGVSTLVQVRNAALANEVTMIPHGWSTAVGMAADIQVMSTMPQGPLRMVEYMPKPTVTELLQGNPFDLDDEGMLHVSTEPGLGIRLK